eukprot:Gb_17815 [translate_table: standard]
MVSGSAINQVTSKVEAKRVWNGMVKDSHNLLPKLLPDLISSISTVQGAVGSVGSVRQINFTPGNKDFSYAKERLDEVDDSNFVTKYTAIEGGLIGKALSAATFELKLSPTNEGGCVSTWTCHYDTLDDAPPDELKIQELKATSMAIFNKVEQFLLANPNLYS